MALGYDGEIYRQPIRRFINARIELLQHPPVLTAPARAPPREEPAPRPRPPPSVPAHAPARSRTPERKPTGPPPPRAPRNPEKEQERALKEELKELEARRKEIRQQLMKQIPEMHKFLIPNKTEQLNNELKFQEQMDREDEKNRINERRVNLVYDAENIVKSYDEWKQTQKDDKQVNHLTKIQQRHHQGTDFHFDKLDKLNDKYSRHFFVWLKTILENEIGPLPADDYTVRFKIMETDHWVSIPLNKASYDKILKNRADNSFIFDDVGAVMTFALSGADKDIQLNTFTSIHINKNPSATGEGAHLNAPQEQGGADFRYIYIYIMATTKPLRSI
jgi:hypothetical protein